MSKPEPSPTVRSLPPPGRTRALALALCLVGLGASACQESSAVSTDWPNPNPTEGEIQALIGGFAANDPRLDSIGALVLIPPYPALNEHLCGASVIGPETLVTAKHCADIIPFVVSLGYRLGFAVGPDIRRPKRVYDLAAYQLAPGDSGGFVGYGRDVAVLHLEHPLPPGLMPLKIEALTDADLGNPFAAIGYGVQDNAQNHGTRRLGRQTLKGREGRTLEHLFGTFERFLEWFVTGAVSAENLAKAFPGREGGGGEGGSGTGGGAGSGGGDVPELEKIARYYWDLFVLEKNYEVVTGGFPGDAQPCFGDSGSSLVKYKDGKYVSYGVVSGGLGTRDVICDLGTVYATFGPEVAAFLDNAKNWVDPCGDLDSKGVCDGNVARRCTNLVEGRRRVVEFDCGLVGMECNTLTGQVSCDGNEFGPPPPPTHPAPTPPEIRQMVDGVFRGVRR